MARSRSAASVFPALLSEILDDCQQLAPLQEFPKPERLDPRAQLDLLVLAEARLQIAHYSSRDPGPGGRGWSDARASGEARDRRFYRDSYALRSSRRITFCDAVRGS